MVYLLERHHLADLGHEPCAQCLEKFIAIKLCRNTDRMLPIRPGGIADPADLPLLPLHLPNQRSLFDTHPYPNVAPNPVHSQREISTSI